MHVCWSYLPCLCQVSLLVLLGPKWCAGMCTGYQLWGDLAFQELFGLLQQSGAQVMVVYFTFNFLSQVAELNQAAALTAAGKRLSKVLSSLCRPLARRTLCACLPTFLLLPCSFTIMWWYNSQSLWYLFVPTHSIVNFHSVMSCCVKTQGREYWEWSGWDR